MFILIVMIGFLCCLFGVSDSISDEEWYFLMEEERRRNERE